MAITVKSGRTVTGIEEVADGIYCLRLQIPGVHTVFSIYIIKEGGGALIEPGPATLIPEIRAAVRKLDMDDLIYIILTHIHLDHAGAAGGLVPLFPGAAVVVHPRGLRHIVDPSRLIKSTRLAFGPDFESTYGAIQAVPEARVRAVRDGERLAIDGRELMVVHTPGHAPHHMAILDAGSGTLFCGEALGLFYHEGIEPLPAVAPPGFDQEAYLGSMARLAQLKPRRLLYSHGGISQEPEKAIADVIRNTRLVGDVILDALRAGETDDAIVRIIGDYLQEHFGARLAEYDLESNVKGYIYYFRKKGLA